MSTEGTSRPSIKVTDKRLFTEEGDLRDPDSLEKKEAESSTEQRVESRKVDEVSREDVRSERKPEAEKDNAEVTNPGTMFTSFLDSLVVNAYMALGMVRHPYRADQQVDVEGARQMIDIIEMLEKKTKGNLTAEESSYLKTHLGELKLAFVRRSQSIG